MHYGTSERHAHGNDDTDHRRIIVKRATSGILAVALCTALPTMVIGAAPEGTGTWFDSLEAGVCFDDAFLPSGDFDYTMPPVLVPCDGPHDNEVVGWVPLGEVELASEELVPIVDELCEAEHESFLGRPIDSTLMFPFNVAPDPDDWAAGVNQGLCIVYAGEPVLGSAASGVLRAPGESLAVYHEVDNNPNIWLVDAGTGEAVRNISDNDLAELITAPAWTPDGEAVAFSAKVDSSDTDTDIYLAPIDGSDAEVLVDSPALDEGAAFSPDGSAIVYFSDADAVEYDIYVRDLASGDTTHLDRDSSPQWSPDGRHIAFRRRTDGVSDIWVMAADGSEQRQLTDNGGNNYDPRWSPNGSLIAFTTNVAGNYDIGAS
jgi:Tol biopolymer transport system component